MTPQDQDKLATHVKVLRNSTVICAGADFDFDLWVQGLALLTLENNPPFDVPAFMEASGSQS